MTKGKWRVGLQKERAVLCETENGKILTICVTDIGNNISQEEAIENAKLISAAPELLKACQSFVNDFELDYMLDGKIVDKPSNLLLVNYEIAKKAVLSAISE